MSHIKQYDYELDSVHRTTDVALSNEAVHLIERAVSCPFEPCGAKIGDPCVDVVSRTFLCIPHGYRIKKFIELCYKLTIDFT